MRGRGRTPSPSTTTCPSPDGNSDDHLRCCASSIGRAAGTRILAVLEPQLEHHEAGHDEGRSWPVRLAALTTCSVTAASLGWDPARGASTARRRGGRTFQTISTPLVRARSPPECARPGDHVLVMSNGGFGGVHARILDALVAKRADAILA